ncbi:MAG: putative quinol monooxygenase [Parvibaculaceae bacterium]
MSASRTTIVIAGTLVLKPGTFERLRPHMLAMIEASRAETGCLAYAYALDIEDPLVLRVHEEWTDRAALERHFRTAHLKAWRAELARVGIESRELVSWSAADPVRI